MANEPNKRKNSSHTRRTFYDLLLQIPIVGKPIHNLLKRKGGIIKKLGAISPNSDSVGCRCVVALWTQRPANDQSQ